MSKICRATMIFGSILLMWACDCPQPQIQSMSPSSGPGGTIVEVTYSGGGLSGVIIFDGTSVKTHSAGNLGIGNILRFTIPYGSGTGNKNVQVRSDGQTSPAQAFNVTGIGSVPTPVLDGFSIANRDGEEITLFGSGFSTLSEVYINGTEVSRYAGNSLPLRALPFAFVDNAIICTPATALTLGSSYNVQVRNPGGVNSNTLNITVPDRVCVVEFDALENIPIPDYYVWQNSTVNSFRRTYTDAGWIIELSYGDTSIVDPESGSAFTNADMYSFWQANASPPSGEYFMHGSFLTDGNPSLRGVMFMWDGYLMLPSSEHRQGFANFWNAFASGAARPARFFRTAIHESGHGFNLYHSDNSASQTVMTTTSNLATGWNCFFSSTSSTHNSSHNLTDVGPGGTDWGDRTCH